MGRRAGRRGPCEGLTRVEDLRSTHRRQRARQLVAELAGEESDRRRSARRGGRRRRRAGGSPRRPPARRRRRVPAGPRSRRRARRRCPRCRGRGRPPRRARPAVAGRGDLAVAGRRRRRSDRRCAPPCGDVGVGVRGGAVITVIAVVVVFAEQDAASSRFGLSTVSRGNVDVEPGQHPEGERVEHEGPGRRVAAHTASIEAPCSPPGRRVRGRRAPRRRASSSDRTGSPSGSRAASGPPSPSASTPASGTATATGRATLRRRDDREPPAPTRRAARPASMTAPGECSEPPITTTAPARVLGASGRGERPLAQHPLVDPSRLTRGVTSSTPGWAVTGAPSTRRWSTFPNSTSRKRPSTRSRCVTEALPTRFACANSSSSVSLHPSSTYSETITMASCAMTKARSPAAASKSRKNERSRSATSAHDSPPGGRW